MVNRPPSGSWGPPSPGVCIEYEGVLALPAPCVMGMGWGLPFCIGMGVLPGGLCSQGRVVFFLSEVGWETDRPQRALTT